MGTEIALPAEEILDTGAAAAGAGAPWRVIGHSREGREVLGCRLGRGEAQVSLIGGCHADEPVGPEMLRRLAGYLAALPADAALLSAVSWWIVPHVNPDGAARNSAWSEATVAALDCEGRPDRVFDLALYLRHVVREGPGDDLEFGFPRTEDDRGARPESRAVAAFLAGGRPFRLHGSFHGIGFAPGPWFLIEPSWIERTADLRRALRARVRAMGYRPYDVDRQGEKGFRRIDEGFSTRPDSRAMAEHFVALGDDATAALFRPSSMEFVRSLGGDPFTLVSEMPLFLRPPMEQEGRRPDERAERSRLLADLTAAAVGGDADLRAEAERRGLRGMPLRDQMRLQLAFLEAGLRAAVG